MLKLDIVMTVPGNIVLRDKPKLDPVYGRKLGLSAINLRLQFNSHSDSWLRPFNHFLPYQIRAGFDSETT